MHRVGVLSLGVALGCLYGCATYSVDYDDELNRALTYLPWQAPTPTDKFAHKQFDVMPGMRLVFAMMSLTQQHTNLMPLPASITRWVVPTDDTPSPEDLFIYAWLLDIAAPPYSKGHDVDTFQFLEHQARYSGDNKQPPGFGDEFYRTIRQTFRVKFNHRDHMLSTLETPPWSAQQIKYWMCSGSRKDIGDDKNIPYAETLQFEIQSGENGSLRTLQTFGWNSWFIDSNSGTDPRYRNVYYDHNNGSDIHGRGALTIEIPVRLFDESESRYVSACTTVEDYERASGLIVSAIRRSRAFLPDFHDQFGYSYTQPDRSGLVTAADDYFTIDFGSPLLAPSVGSPLIDGAMLHKADILLAPGDVLVAHRDPSRATDVMLGETVP